ncbi:MAG TPA: L-2-amino-thiazoline-4-carboxylic acid hydrolase [Micropepsaceae bacterium]|nr:L-2-amino-thiazoline-4-carboxylic acid hydrolase [Micropepsaceae bacterium]
MSKGIEQVPENARWELATKSLTGAYIAISNAFRQALGQKKLEEFNASLWHEAAKEAKAFAQNFELPTKTAADVEAITHLYAKASMGPEFVFEVVEATQDRCVGRTTQCPWHKRWKEQGLDFDICSAGHQRWGDGVAESLNPNFTFKLTKNMVRGDAHCEWVVERKK